MVIRYEEWEREENHVRRRRRGEELVSYLGWRYAPRRNDRYWWMKIWEWPAATKQSSRSFPGWRWVWHSSNEDFPSFHFNLTAQSWNSSSKNSCLVFIEQLLETSAGVPEYHHLLRRWQKRQGLQWLVAVGWQWSAGWQRVQRSLLTSWRKVSVPTDDVENESWLHHHWHTDGKCGQWRFMHSQVHTTVSSRSLPSSFRAFLEDMEGYTGPLRSAWLWGWYDTGIFATIKLKTFFFRALRLIGQICSLKPPSTRIGSLKQSVAEFWSSFTLIRPILKGTSMTHTLIEKFITFTVHHFR